MAIEKIPDFKGRYRVLGHFYARAPYYGYTLEDAKLADKLGKEIIKNKNMLTKLWEKSMKEANSVHPRWT